MLHYKKILNELRKSGVLTENDSFDDYIELATKRHLDIEEVVAQQKNVPLESVYETAAAAFGIEYKNLQSASINPALLQLLPETIVQTHQTVIFDQTDSGELFIATRDPDDLQTVNFIQKKTEKELQLFYTDTSSIRNIVSQYHKTIEEAIKDVTAAPLEEESYTGITELNRIARDIPIVKIVDILLEYAIYQSASDIHVEPTETEIHVRYRIDGVLYDVATFPSSVQAPLTARIKVLANLKIDEHRLPQDGRFKINSNEKQIAFRVSILPVYDGEKIVMRLLDESAKVLTFEQLGMHETQAEIFKRNIRKPNGILLVTGPTGSGKTTTLYSALNVLNTRQVNISTVEDPIEYRIQGVNQSQISPKIGFTFAAGLRSLLRQDPNIIMVGEIRDGETAEIAAHAAMTGHLVLSTLHTNDAVGAIPRLAEMNVPRYLIASTTNLVLAQRLVRKICDDCKIQVDIDADFIAQVGKQFKVDDMIQTLVRFGELEAGATSGDLHFYKGAGCKECGNRGYRGRIGIYEVFEVTEAIAELIIKEATQEVLLQKAMESGMMTMVQDGLIKAKQGMTTIDEVLRVTKE